MNHKELREKLDELAIELPTVAIGLEKKYQALCQAAVNSGAPLSVVMDWHTQAKEYYAKVKEETFLSGVVCILDKVVADGGDTSTFSLNYEYGKHEER